MHNLNIYFGEMAEWSKAHAWKVCKRQKRFMGSNPILSAENNFKKHQNPSNPFKIKYLKGFSFSQDTSKTTLKRKVKLPYWLPWQKIFSRVTKFE